MKITVLTVLMTMFMLAASTTAAAQQQARPVHVRTAADSSRVERQKSANLKAFRGIAAKLNTTPLALQNAFETARAADPKLSRGNFIAANMLAHNLGARYPAITTQAILSGLQSDDNLGRTLQRLGLSAAAAKSARWSANHDVKAADKRVKDAEKCAKDADTRARREQRSQ